MSEKRFRVRFEQENGRGEIVNKKGIELTAREVVDLLNKLSEENEQLQKELDNFKPVMFQDMRKGTVILYSKR